MCFIVSLDMHLQLGIGMNGHKGVLVSAADPEVGAAIAPDVDLLPGAPASIFLAGNDITVGATGHTSIQSHIQVPEGITEKHRGQTDVAPTLLLYLF